MPTVPGNWFTSFPSGSRLHFSNLGMQESFSLDSQVSKIRMECVWDDAPSIKRDFFGTAKYIGGAPRLTRQQPYQNQFYTSHYIDRMDLLQDPQPEATNSSYVGVNNLTGWPDIDGYAQYVLSFSPRPYPLLSDTEVQSLYERWISSDQDKDLVVPEMLRNIRCTRRYLPESRKVPTAGFEVYDDATGTGHPAFTAFVIQEVGSLPTFQVEIIAEMLFWPKDNVPFGAIEDCLGCVNAKEILLDGRRYPAGTLLYKGPATELTPYKWIDGLFYFDIPHLFGYRPQGWNMHRLNAPIAADNNRQWYPIRVKGVSGNQPMFQKKYFTKLFTPEMPAANLTPPPAP